MLLYACNIPIPETMDGVGDFCYQQNKAQLISACTGTIFGWPTGGNVSYNITSYFLMFLAATFTRPILGPLTPLFWISSDITFGFQSQSGFCLICISEANVIFIH